jgi:DNA-binding transcriptional ArsR family regulator
VQQIAGCKPAQVQHFAGCFTERDCAIIAGVASVVGFRKVVCPADCEGSSGRVRTPAYTGSIASSFVNRVDPLDDLGQRILALLGERPGLRSRDLAAHLGSNARTVERRLVGLKKDRRAVDEMVDRHVHWFPADAEYGSERVRRLAAHLHYPGRGRVLRALAEEPRTLTEVALALGVETSTIYRVVKPLVADGLLELGEGRAWRLAAGLGAVLQKHLARIEAGWREAPEAANVAAAGEEGEEAGWWAGGS